MNRQKKKIIEWLEEKGAGAKAVNYKLRDWLFSRQRYWGEPFPIIRVGGEPKAILESELPLKLPEVEKYQPVGNGEPPLANAMDWVKTTDPETGKPALRETNTMPQWAGSCWYYLRYISPNWEGGPVHPDYEKYWMPVDLYVGGAEHAVLHLLYARFWHKVLFDLGMVSTKEPFQKLVNQGMILGEMEYTAQDGSKIEEEAVEKRGDSFFRKGTDFKVEARAHKMSKSRGNMINPDHVIEQFGADSLRLYEMFMGPLEQVKPWSTKGVDGVNRFLNRTWRLILMEETGELKTTDSKPTKKQLKVLHTVIKKVTEDIEEMRFNTAISAMMIFINEANGWDKVPVSLAKDFVKLLSPFAPHFSEELWNRLGESDSIAYATWPAFNEEYMKEDEIMYPVQVNGKVRADVFVPANEAKDKEFVLNLAKNEEKVAKYLEQGNLVKEIFVPGRIVNLVVK